MDRPNEIKELVEHLAKLQLACINAGFSEMTTAHILGAETQNFRKFRNTGGFR